MTISLLLAISGVLSLALVAVLARRYLRTDRGLRRAFAGLRVSGSAGVALTVTHKPAAVWPLAAIMLAGVGFMMWALHVVEVNKVYSRLSDCK
jgi:drug/metabolite transporter (DMT)-like permease